MTISAFRWAVGTLLAAMGAMMLIVPHQFTSVAYVAFQPHLGEWGTVFLLLGLNLVAVTVQTPRRPFEIAAHLLSGAALLLLTYGYLPANGWTGIANFGVLGLGTALAPFVGNGYLRSGGKERDWLPIVCGTGAVLAGAIMLALPSLFDGPTNAPFRPYLTWIGLAFLAGGAAAVSAQLLPRVPRSMLVLAHLALGCAFLSFFFVSAIPIRAWLGMAYYGGFGLLLAVSPWLKSWTERVDPASLRFRLALILSIVAALPLMLNTAFALDRQEDATALVALSRQQTLAVSIARDVSDYVRLNRAAVEALAVVPGLLELTPEKQHEILRSFKSVYPDVYALVTADLTSKQIARSDDLPLVGATGQPLYERARQTGSTQIMAQISSATNRPILAMTTPVVGTNGQMMGFAGGALELARVSEAVLQAASASGGRAYLVDERGHVIAHPDSTLVSSFADLSQQPPVAAMLADQGGSGSLQYGASNSEALAGYARVPGLGWGVVVEQPASIALVGIRSERDLVFLVLILVAVMAAGVGFALADTLVRPLGDLVEVVGKIALGARGLDLPMVPTTEIQLLADAVDEMQDKLQVVESDRERLLAEVTRERSLLQRLLENVASVGICVLNGSELRVKWANPAYLEFLEEPYRSNGVVGRRLHDFVPRTVESGLEEVFRQVARTGQVHVAPEYRHEGFARGITYWHWSLVPVSDPTRDTPDLMIVAVEVTEQVMARRRVEELASQAQSSLAQLKAVVENMTEGVAIYNAAGTPIMLNRALLELHGFEYEGDLDRDFLKMAGRRTLYAMDGALVPLEEWPIWRVLRGETIVGFEGRVGRADRPFERVFSYNGAPVMDKDGRVEMAVVTIQDVTERKRAEAALRESEARLRRLYESGLIGVGYWDMDGVITDANDKFLEMVGYTREDLEAGLIDWTNMTPPEYRELDERAIAELKAIGVDTPYEKEYIRRDGSRVPIIVGAATFDEDRHKGIAFVLDITERKQAEAEREKLLAAEREARSLAEKAVRIRDEFVSVAAHELKTPVTSLKGFAQVLMRQYEKIGSIDTQRVLKAMKVIDDQSRRLSNLTEQLLNLSRLETGKLTLAREETDLLALVENLVLTIRHSHPERTIVFRDGENVTAVVDPDRVEQVITNLVDNAIKFSGADAPVEVDLSRDPSGWVKIAVRDHGIGVPEEKRPHIFERFFQAHPELHSNGMGIGLSVSKQIVEMHGGTITLEQPEDGGSRFIVHLPLVTIEGVPGNGSR